MRVGVCILTFFGMVWGCAALLLAGAGGLVLVLPPVAAALVLAASLVGMPRDAVSPEQLTRNRRTVRWWSLVEGLAMLTAVLLLQRAGAPRHIPSAFAVIVGLHFLPMAVVFPQPVFYATAAAMVGAGVLSMLLASAQLQGEVASLAAAVALWGTALGVMLYYRRASPRRVGG